jgi:hypothetical protein
MSDVVVIRGGCVMCVVRCALCVVRCAWCVVRGAWYVVRGTWYVVRGTWCVVRGAWCVVRSGACVYLEGEEGLLASLIHLISCGFSLWGGRVEKKTLVLRIPSFLCTNHAPTAHQR